MTALTQQKLKDWAIAALIRAVKTAAQTALAMIPVGVTIAEVSWLTVCGTAALAAVLSLLTSVAGLPEVHDGETLSSILSTVEGKHGADE